MKSLQMPGILGAVVKNMGFFLLLGFLVPHFRFFFSLAGSGMI